MEYRTCKVCGETKEAVQGTWVTRRGKPVGKTCLVCKAAVSLRRYHANPDVKTKQLDTIRKLRATEAGLESCRAAGRKYSRSVHGKLKVAADYTARMAQPGARKKHSAVSLRWARNNPDKANAKNMLRKLGKLQRIVAWADNKKIAVVYKKAALLTAATGIKHTVDHIVPLRGKLVSGLHVHNNLQIITRSENSSKGNKWNVE